MPSMTRAAARARVDVYTFCKHIAALPAGGGTLTPVVDAVVDRIVSVHKRSSSTARVNVVPPCRRHAARGPGCAPLAFLPPARAGSAAHIRAACQGRREAAFRAMLPAKPHGARVARPTPRADGPGRACTGLARLDAAHVRPPLPSLAFGSLRGRASPSLARPAARLAALARRLCRAAQVCAALVGFAARCASVSPPARVTDFPRHVRCFRNVRAGGFGLLRRPRLGPACGRACPERATRKAGGQAPPDGGRSAMRQHGLTRSPGGGKPPTTAAGAGAPAARRASLHFVPLRLLAAPSGPPVAPPAFWRPRWGGERPQGRRQDAAYGGFALPRARSAFGSLRSPGRPARLPFAPRLAGALRGLLRRPCLPLRGNQRRPASAARRLARDAGAPAPWRWKPSCWPSPFQTCPPEPPPDCAGGQHGARQPPLRGPAARASGRHAPCVPGLRLALRATRLSPPSVRRLRRAGFY